MSGSEGSTKFVAWLGFAGVTLAAVIAGAFGLLASNGADSSDEAAAPTTSRPMPSAPTSTTTSATPSPSGEPEVFRRGTVKLSARTQIDLDSSAENWGVAEEGEEPYTDVWMNVHDVSAVNDAVMAKATGSSHEQSKSATDRSFLKNGELKREIVYLAVTTNGGHLASIVIDPDKVTYESGFFDTFTVDIVVWSA